MSLGSFLRKFGETVIWGDRSVSFETPVRDETDLDYLLKEHKTDAELSKAYLLLETGLAGGTGFLVATQAFDTLIQLGFLLGILILGVGIICEMSCQNAISNKSAIIKAWLVELKNETLDPLVSLRQREYLSKFSVENRMAKTLRRWTHSALVAGAGVLFVTLVFFVVL